MKTMAIQKLDDFFCNNYKTMMQLATWTVGANNAGDAVNDTYLSLLEKEQRGVGHYDENYGATYEEYIYGILRGILKGFKKPNAECTETDLLSKTASESLEFIANVPSEENIEAHCDTLDSPMVVVSELVSVCADCGTNVEFLINAVRAPEGLHKSLIAKMFAPLRHAARRNSGIVSAVEDFIRIYGDNPKEVEVCLSELGVVI